MGRLYVFGVGLAGTVLIAACDPSLSEDFDSFCRVVNETNKQANLPATERLLLITGRAPEYSLSAESKSADSLWKKMDALPTDKRYAFLTQTAHASGKADYKCNGYEKLLVTATVELAAKEKAAQEKAAAEAAAASATPDGGVSPDAGTVAEKKTKKAKKKKGRKKKRRE